MKKSSKELLFERMHKIGGMPLKESVFERNGVTINTSPDLGAFKDRIQYKIGDAILDIAKYNRFYSVIEFNVPENYRRQGIGSKLVKTAMDDLTYEGFSAQVSNDNSLMLFYNLGFRSYNDDGQELSLEETKERRKKQTSVNMFSPTLSKKLFNKTTSSLQEQWNPTVSDEVKRHSNMYEGRNVIWYGNPDQMIVIHKNQVHGMWGNVYDQDKLNSLVELIRETEEKVELECSYGIGDVITLTDIQEQQESYHGGSFESDYEELDRPRSTGDEELDQYLGVDDLDVVDNFSFIDRDNLGFLIDYRRWLAQGDITSENLRTKMETEIGNTEGLDEFLEFEQNLRDAMQNKEGDLGQFEVQLRDGHHRVMAAIEAGEEYVCLNLVKEQIGKFNNYITRVTTSAGAV